MYIFFQDCCYSQLFFNCFDVNVFFFEGERRCLGNDFKVLNICQCIDDFFGDVIIEIFIVGIVVYVDKGQYSN